MNDTRDCWLITYVQYCTVYESMLRSGLRSEPRWGTYSALQSPDHPVKYTSLHNRLGVLKCSKTHVQQIRISQIFRGTKPRTPATGSALQHNQQAANCLTPALYSPVLFRTTRPFERPPDHIDVTVPQRSRHTVPRNEAATVPAPHGTPCILFETVLAPRLKDVCFPLRTGLLQLVGWTVTTILLRVRSKYVSSLRLCAS